MTFEEKRTWAYVVVALVVPGAYVAYVLLQAGDTPMTEVGYVRAMIVAGVTSILAIAFSHGFVRGDEGAEYQRDERDRDIARRGDYVGGIVLSAAVAGVLVLTWSEADHFWIANALYLSFVAQAVISSVIKLMAYRRGL